MAEAEQKIITKSYLPQKFDKLSPSQKTAYESQKSWLPEDYGKDFDVNADHDSWVKFCREGGDACQKAIDVWPTPDSAFADNLPYKKTSIAPIEDVLTCECTVFEPLKDAEDKMMFIYIHGGGMAMFDGKGVMEWGPATYAMDGHIGATVLFTNSVDECYPRGLNDTISGVKYLATKYKDQVKGICLHGESGGANLVVAAMMKLKQEEPEKDYVDCIYVECAYLYPVNGIPEEVFATPEDIKGSIEEFREEGGAVSVDSFGQSCFRCYKGPEKDTLEHLQDKFAWPYFATEEDFKNFPPTYVQSNECDGLKDIGLRFYRQLVGAGVEAFHTIEAGTFHAGEKNNLMYNRMVTKRRETLLSCVLEHRAQKEQQAKAAAEAKEE